MGQSLAGNATPGNFVTDSVISNVTIAASASSPNSATYTNGGAAGAEIDGWELSIAVGYGATISGGPANVAICRQVDNTPDFESSAYAWAFQHVASPTASTVVTITKTIAANGAFQVVISNPSGNSSLTGVTIRARPIQKAIG